MYYAKALGRGRFQFYTEELNSRMARQFTLEHDLRHALREGEFILHYQPQVALAGGRVVGVEALLRWNHPEKGVIYPSAFLVEAAEAGSDYYGSAPTIFLPASALILTLPFCPNPLRGMVLRWERGRSSRELQAYPRL